MKPTDTSVFFEVNYVNKQGHWLLEPQVSPQNIELLHRLRLNVNK